MVFYDLDEIRRLVELEGKEIEFFGPELDFVLEIRQPDGAGYIRMGRHLFNRLAYEFSSPLWLLRITEERLNWHEASNDNGSSIVSHSAT